MKLNIQQNAVYEYVKQMHGDQKRKYTGLPYHEHCAAVARIAHQYDKTPGVIEAALCHDLFEDTDCNPLLLLEFLVKCNYTKKEGSFIVNLVIELTDEFTHEAYPDKNRSERKRLEAKRLRSTHSCSQNIKYADIIDNTLSIVAHDQDFAKVFVDEAMRSMDRMGRGNYQLYTAAHTILLGCGFMLNSGQK